MLINVTIIIITVIIIQLFIIYMSSQQLQGQLRTQHSAVIGNYITDTQHKIKNKLQEHSNAEKQTKETKIIGKDNYKHRTSRLRTKHIL
jgi:predicted Holliday junction resolvase-like endonuclease